MPENGLYRSNKNGHLYEVITIAYQVETKQELVIYKQCFGEQRVYAKTFDEWNRVVTVDGIERPRFERIEQEIISSRATPEAILSDYYGYDSFRPNQREIIDTILDQKDSLNILPTGAGKSICFQVPAMLMDGLTIVISPLIALMADQVAGLKLAGIPAEYYNSSLNNTERERIRTAVRSKSVKLLYIAPEQLDNGNTLSFLRSIPVSMVVVDEAHCVSQWGHDFRPAYLKIKDFIRQLPERPVVAAFTATATSKIISDITTLLNLRNPEIIRASVDRPNLYYSVLRPENKSQKMLELIRARSGRAGIVYCATKRIATEQYTKLKENGIPVALYHAGLSDQKRSENQRQFMNGDVDVIVATNAFGMGIDKPDVAFVIHYNMPKSLEEYYQEAGRAGRDGNNAECILLYSAEDFHIQKKILEHDVPQAEDPVAAQQLRENNSKRLLEMIRYCTSPDCLRQRILTYFGEQANTHCGNCYNCDHTHEMCDVTEEAIAILKCVSEINGQYGRERIVDVLKGSQAKAILDRPQLINNLMYGKLKDVHKHRLWLIINHLISEGILNCVERTGRRGEVFLLIELGNEEKVRNILSGVEKVFIFLPEDTAQTVHSAEVETNNELYEKLRKLRNSIAFEENVRPYMVFHNATIQSMAEVCPKSLEELGTIPGIGRVKLERYGQRFLNAIQEYHDFG